MLDYCVIIQARMESSRLPGKSMMEIGGRSLLDYLVCSISNLVPKNKIIVATSERNPNDAIREYCQANHIECYSGDENNVASRYVDILSKRKPKVFHRICGDTPYYAGELILRGNEMYEADEKQFISSMPNKGYPMGCNLELFNTSFFLEGCKIDSKYYNAEHVTSGFYKWKDDFNHSVVHCNIPGYSYNKYKFSVDTIEDFEVAKYMLDKMNYNPWNYSFAEKINIQQNLLECS